jgi:predicted DNA-binding ribbon-helix-helix protein
MRARRLPLKPRPISIHGHVTSLKLEPEMWYWLRQIAAECKTTATALIEGIVIAKSPHRSLSSALRVFIAGFYHDMLPHDYFPDPDSQQAYRIQRRPSQRKVQPRDAMMNAVHRLQLQP